MTNKENESPTIVKFFERKKPSTPNPSPESIPRINSNLNDTTSHNIAHPDPQDPHHKSIPPIYTPEPEDNTDKVDNNKTELLDADLSFEALAKKHNFEIPKVMENKLKFHMAENKKFIETVKDMQEIIDKITTLPKDEIQKIQKSTLFSSLQSATGIQNEQLDVALSNILELEKYTMMIEKDNLRLLSILRGYGYEETKAQRELLLADYTPLHQQKLQRQLDAILFMQGYKKDEELLMSDYISGKISRTELEKNMKKFIISNPANNISFSDSNNVSIVSEFQSTSQPTSDVTPTPQHTCISSHPHSGHCSLSVINNGPSSPDKTTNDIRLVEKPPIEMATSL